MKAVIQRVSRAAVRVEGVEHASIGAGLLLLVAVERGDDSETAEKAAEKIAGLRVFAARPGVDERMDQSVVDIHGEVLVVSQFTLAGSIRRGRRPSFDDAAPPEQAEAIYLHLVSSLGRRGVPVATGVFGSMMQVDLVNDGPVTLLLDLGP